MTQCERCKRPVSGTEYVCTACVRPVAEDLASVPSLAEELPAARYRQTRYGSGGLGGWQEPWDDRAREVEHAVTNTLTTVARDVAETRGIEIVVKVPPAVHGPLCARWCQHGSCFDVRRTRREPCTWVDDGCQHGVCANSRARASLHPAGLVATWLVGQIDWIRHQSEALGTLDELRNAVRQLRHAVDRPGDAVYAGACGGEAPVDPDDQDAGTEPCGADVRYQRGAKWTKCSRCGSQYEVAKLAATMLEHAKDQLAHAEWAAQAISAYRDPPVTASQIRGYAHRGRLVAHGHDEAERPQYRIGDILVLLELIDAETAVREARRARAEARRAERDEVNGDAA